MRRWLVMAALRVAIWHGRGVMRLIERLRYLAGEVPKRSGASLVNTDDRR